MQTVTKLTFLFLLTNAIALKIYKSNIASNGEKIITGLHYKRQENENPTLANILTTCIRLKLKRLGNLGNPGYKDNSAPLIFIPGKEFVFLGISAGYPYSWILLGNHNYGKTSYFSKPLRDPISNSTLIWKPYTWHHICFSYSEQNLQIRLVKVRRSLLIYITKSFYT